MSLSLCIILLIDSSYTKSLLLKNLRDFYLKYKSLRTSRRSCHHPQQHCCPGIAHSPFLSWVLLLLRLSDQAQIWLPLAMINDFSYPQRLRSSTFRSSLALLPLLAAAKVEERERKLFYNFFKVRELCSLSLLLFSQL